MEKPTKKQILRAVLWAVIALTLVFIWSRSARGKVASDGESQWVTELLREIFRTDSISHAFVRKLAHFTEFALLGAELSLLLWLERKASVQWYVNIWFAGSSARFVMRRCRFSAVGDPWCGTSGWTRQARPAASFWCWASAR